MFGSKSSPKVSHLCWFKVLKTDLTPLFRGKIHIFWVSVEVNAILEPFHPLLGKIGALK